MKNLITPLLSGILEVSADKMWSFDQFFAYVTKISKLKAFYVFNFATLEPIDLYLDPKITLSELKSHIFVETLIESEDQLLLVPCDTYQKAYNEWKSKNTPFSVDIDECKPFFMFSTSSNNINIKSLDVQKLSFPAFLKNLHVENDSVQGKLSCSIGYLFSVLLSSTGGNFFQILSNHMVPLF